MAEDGGDFTVVSDSLKLRAFDVDVDVLVLVDVEFDVDSVTIVWLIADMLIAASPAINKVCIFTVSIPF